MLISGTMNHIVREKMDLQANIEPEEKSVQRPNLLSRRSFFREFGETLLLIIAIYTLVNLATARFVVEGQSMYPSFEGEEYLIVSRFEYLLSDPQRGDIVVFHYPENPERDFIKRVVGLPGETITMQNGQVFINGVPLDESPYISELCNSSNCRDREWVLGEDEFIVLGDNRNASQDSTRFGAINRSHIIGRAWIRYWPPEDWGIINHHQYGPPPTLPTATPSPIPSATSEPVPTTTALPGTPEIPFNIGG